ncbi:MAG: iron ABC transporter permease [Oscillospiraceae bacterium]|jgi:iron complex transport system permease protein|nr:iron ABC transporter permease [Oscillospiraceae bacterium]
MGLIKGKNKTKKLNAVTLNLVLLTVLITMIVFSVCVGKYSVTPMQSINIIFSELLHIGGGNYSEMTRNVVMGLRIPRILSSVVVGACLAMSGAAYQGTFKNPLISPDFLGVSSGACIGAAIAILLSLGSAYVQIFAFIGGIAAVVLTVAIPAVMQSKSNIMFVLAGIIVGGLMSSILGYIKYVADPQTQLASITYWMMGSFSYITLKDLLRVLPAIAVSAAILIAISWWIDIMSMGESEAKALGANVPVIRNISIICSTLLTASSVCICGTIGWVGLVVPHFGRMIAGPDNTRLIPAAGLIGAIFLLCVDTATRTIGTAEMPISILTGIIGAPFYAWLLYRQRKSMT